MKRLQCSRTINANKFHHTADKIKTQKANEVETQRIEFKGLKVPITWCIDHIAGNFGGNQQIINIPTLKRIVERNGCFNRHRDTCELNVNAQNLLLTRLLVRHLREKTRTFYADVSRSVFKMAASSLTRNKIQREYTITRAQNLNR